MQQDLDHAADGCWAHVLQAEAQGHSRHVTDIAYSRSQSPPTGRHLSADTPSHDTGLLEVSSRRRECWSACQYAAAGCRSGVVGICAMTAGRVHAVRVLVSRCVKTDLGCRQLGQHSQAVPAVKRNVWIFNVCASCIDVTVEVAHQGCCLHHLCHAASTCGAERGAHRQPQT